MRKGNKVRDSRDHRAETTLGPIFIAPSGANHLHVSSRNGNDLERTHQYLTLRGCEYYVSAHFYGYKDGTFNIGPEFCEKGVLTNAYQRGQSLYISNHTASQSARNKLAEVLTEAVTKWVSEN